MKKNFICRNFVFWHIKTAFVGDLSVAVIAGSANGMQVGTSLDVGRYRYALPRPGRIRLVKYTYSRVRPVFATSAAYT